MVRMSGGRWGSNKGTQKNLNHSFLSYGLIRHSFNSAFDALISWVPAFTSTLSAVDSTALDAKTPFLLIHNGGKEGGGALAYWQNFISHFNQNWDLSHNINLYL